jgi:hypothetical protein
LNSEFNWWLLIVGLVAGAALVWLVLADSARREADLEDDEIPMEAAWIAATLREDGEEIDPQTADRVLRLHRAYLAAPPPDGPARPRASSGEPATDWSTELPRAAEGSPPDQADVAPPRRPKAAPPAD